jgi:hypothetical protein
MNRRIAAVACAAVLGVIAPSGLVIAAGISTSIKDLMVSVIDPSADVVWGAAGTVIDKDEGIREMAPKTNEEWLDVRSAAVRLIEGANLLTMPGRDVAPAGTKSETPGVELEPAEIAALINRNRRSFDGFARALQAVGLEALRASEAKNTGSLLEIGGRMQEVCESCHQAFWYPNQGPPQSDGRRLGP